MPRLKLRREFQGHRLRGTAIELANARNTGATQVAAADFLEITYPSTDALAALEGACSGHGRPLVLIGERGQGKSHLLGLLHHGFTDRVMKALLPYVLEIERRIGAWRPSGAQWKAWCNGAA